MGLDFLEQDRFPEIEYTKEPFIKPFGANGRIEIIKMYNGKTYINDSACDNPNALWFTLESCTGPIILITHENTPLKEIELCEKSIKDEIKADLRFNEENYHKTIKTAMDMAEKGDKVILSPGSQIKGLREKVFQEFDRAVKDTF